MGNDNLTTTAPVKFDINEIMSNLVTLGFLVSIISRITNLYLTNLLPTHLEILSRDEMVKIPIMDPELIAHLRLVDQVSWDSLYLSLSELGSSMDIGIDIIENTKDTSPDTLHFKTPFILTIQFFEPDLLPDFDGDDDDDDEDDPVGEKSAPVKTMAMAAGAGRR